MVIQHVETRRGEILLTGLCKEFEEGNKQGIVSGYACEEIGKWFYREAIPILVKRYIFLKKKKQRLRKSGLCLLEKMKEDLAVYQNKESDKRELKVSILLFTSKQYYLFELGGGNVLKLSKEMHLLTKKKHSNFLTGRFGKKDSFLLCSDSFLRKIKQEEIKKSLQKGRIMVGKKIEKVVREIAKRSIQRGERDSITAIYCKPYSARDKREVAMQKKDKNDKTSRFATKQIFGGTMHWKWGER